MDLDPRLRPDDRFPPIALSASNSTTPPPANVGATGSYGSPPPPPSSVNNGVPRADTPLSNPAQQYQPQYDNGAEEANNDAADHKRSRACEACRGLKVRCDPADDDGPCKRCRKAGRKCVVTAPSRKRQKKTDSRVSELEKKIDALTASLHARGHGTGAAASGGHHSSASPTRHSEQTVSPTFTSRHRPSLEDTAGHLPPQGSAPSMAPPARTSISSTPSRREPSVYQPPPMVTAGVKRKASDRSSTADDDRRELPPQVCSSPWTRPDQGDIVDRGIISMDMAADFFRRYTERMAPHMPAVIFPPSQTVGDLRRSKPTLFLAIMAAAGSEKHSLQAVMQRELMTIFAEKVFLSGEKSLELVQALLVTVLWYWPPEHFEELKFYQLVHVAAVMAIDIGLGRKGAPRPPMGPQYNWQSRSFRHQAPLDPNSIESRRAWLGCFFLTSNTSMSLHRPNLVRWTPYMSECVDILNSSPDAAPTDKYFCHLILQHQLGEEIGGQFSLDDPSNVVDINDARTQYALKALERDLEKIKNAVPDDLQKPTLKIGWNMVSLFLHEIALHTKTVPEQIRPPFNTDYFTDGAIGPEPLSATHIGAISSCLSAVDAVFTTFLSMDISEIRCLPVYNFVRVAYGIVILVKLYFSASSPNSELGKVISKGNLRVEYFLDALLDKFRTAATDEKSRPAAKFLVVLAMLKSWFLKQEKQETSKGNNNAAQPQQNTSGAQNRRSTSSANTPLELLSEVAAGSDTSRSGDPRSHFSHLSSLRQPAQPFFHDQQTTTGATPTSTTASSTDMHNNNPNNPPQTSVPPFVDPSAPYQQQQQQIPPVDVSLMGSGLFGNFGIDFEGLGFQPESQEDGAKIMLADPWFSDVFQGFQGMQDNNMFPF